MFIFLFPFILAVNFVVNLIVFFIGKRIFVKTDFSDKTIFISIILITILGAIIDYSTFSVVSNFTHSINILISAFGFLMAFIFITIADFLVFKYYMKIPDNRQTVYLSVFMAVFTNPFILIMLIGPP